MAAKRTSKPTQTPEVLKAVADLVEPPEEPGWPKAVLERKGKELQALLEKEFNESADKVVAEALSELARANAFFARNGNLRVHGNFTINELYAAFKARLDYEAGE